MRRTIADIDPANDAAKYGDLLTQPASNDDDDGGEEQPENANAAGIVGDGRSHHGSAPSPVRLFFAETTVDEKLVMVCRLAPECNEGNHARQLSGGSGALKSMKRHVGGSQFHKEAMTMFERFVAAGAAPEAAAKGFLNAMVVASLKMVPWTRS